MDSAESEREGLLLMAAYLHGTPPDDTGLRRANCAYVLGQVLFWTGQWNKAILEILYGGDRDAAAEAIVGEWYDLLIAMSKREPGRLLEGWGNLGSDEGDFPAAPGFTACGLTDEGWELAKKMLAERPDLEVKPKAFFKAV